MLVLVWCTLIVLRASGDPTRYRFNVWTTENGLPQNSVRAILQTRDGYLWLATLDGLVRFDGVRFTIFNTMNSSGLKSNRIARLFEDDDGTLWVGTEDGGIALLDRLGESLLKAEQGGAVAVWASSAMTEPNAQAAMNREFYRLLFSTATTLGDAAMRAKAVVQDPDVRRTWILLGDPIMRLK
jgi:ligand-binding sensor domain-containing protein